MTESNAFSLGKCYNFGKLMKIEMPDYSWSEIMAKDTWKEFKERRQLTTHQITMTRKGFMGESFTVESKPEGMLMPFGKFKGTPFSELKPRYIEWLSKQDFLDKYPGVSLLVAQALGGNEDAATMDEVRSILKKIE